jgi:hypothetical protein
MNATTRTATKQDAILFIPDSLTLGRAITGKSILKQITRPAFSCQAKRKFIKDVAHRPEALSALTEKISTQEFTRIRAHKSYGSTGLAAIG